MAAENSIPQAPQPKQAEKPVPKPDPAVAASGATLEAAMKDAFGEGKFEVAKEKAQALQTLQPDHRMAAHILEKIRQAEGQAAAKAKAAKIKDLEEALQKATQAGDVSSMTEKMAALKAEDSASRLLLKAQQTMVKAQAEAEKALKKEKVKKLASELDFFVSKADGVGTIAKANELLALEWGHPAAVKALKKAAAEKKMPYESLVTVPDPRPKAKPGFFARLFGLKAEKGGVPTTPKASVSASPAPAESQTPSPAPTSSVLTQKQQSSSSVSEAQPNSGEKAPPPATTLPAIPRLKVEREVVVKGEDEKPEQGNIFTALFGDASEIPDTQEGSVLENIVAKTALEEKEAPKPPKPVTPPAERWAAFAGGFWQFAAVFMVVGAAFLTIENFDLENRVLSLAGKENNASQLHRANETLEQKSQEERQLNRDIAKYEGGYVDSHRSDIARIVANRMDWTDILKKLNEVTESVYEKNALSQYVQYNNYSYQVETGQLTVSGTLSDPLGKNLTKLAELESAFGNHPRDPENPEDERKPYFFGVQEFKAYSKNFNSATGRYQSQFSLTLYTKEPPKK